MGRHAFRKLLSRVTTVIFYEKPGCAGNARQKDLLRRAGHELEIRDLLTWPWTATELRAFFAGLPVADWFNGMAPRVKSGEIVPESFSPDEALSALLADPILIRRPLMQVGERREVGFLAAVVDEWIGLAPAEPVGSREAPLIQLGRGSGGRTA